MRYIMPIGGLYVNRNREYSAKDSILDSLEEINVEISNGRHLVERTNVGKNLSLFNDSFFNRAYFRWLDVNNQDKSTKFYNEFVKESELEDMELTAYEIYFLSDGGNLPIEFFYRKNAHNMKPHVWIDLFYNQFLVRHDEALDNEIFKNIAQTSTTREMLDAFESIVRNYYCDSFIDIEKSQALYRRFIDKEKIYRNHSVASRLIKHIDRNDVADEIVVASIIAFDIYINRENDKVIEFSEYMKNVLVNRAVRRLRERKRFFATNDVDRLVQQALRGDIEMFIKYQNKLEVTKTNIQQKATLPNFDYTLITPILKTIMRSEAGIN